MIVCTHNGALTLGRALRSLTAQRFVRGAYEVVLVDDGSTDETPRIAAASGVRVVRREHSAGLAAARNAGLEVARGHVVAFTDDDCEADADWLEQLVAPLVDGAAVDGVTGDTSVASSESIPFRFLAYRNPLRPLPVSLLESAHPLTRLARYLREDAGPRPGVAQHAHLYALVGANMALRRELVDAVGGFDETIVGAGEEEDLCRRIHRQLGGATFLYEERARVAHHYRPGFGDSLRRARSYGRGNALTKRRAGEFPSLFPFPLLAAAAILVSVRRPRRLLTAALAPLGLYVGWWPVILRRRCREALLYPYMQLLQESAELWGQFQGYRTASR